MIQQQVNKNHQKQHIMTTKRLSILLAEDNPLNQRLAQINIERLGHKLVTATNGQEAVTAFEKHDFDIVLMDINMPQLNGLEASKKIREIEKKNPGKKVKIVALTAYGYEELESYLDAGMDTYCCKPYGSNDLKRILA
jgi:CheY-like chemotaxis protein